MSSKSDIKRIDAILAAIQKKMIALYGQTYQKAVQITQVREAIAAGKIFKWMDDPAAERQFQQMLDKLTRNVELLTTSGCNVGAQTGAGAGLAVIAKANKHDLDQEDAKQQREQIAESLIDTHTNTAGKRGFTSLTLDNGADRLSDRVWKLNQGAKQEMEIIIQNGIKQGKTADEIAKSVQGYLVNPTALYRRVRNKETGELELSEAAKNYHPGQGVYRSAYQNAMRLARTEVNAAYMRAESAAYAKDPLVTAIKIQRSNNHTTLRKGKEVELHDICDELEGTYPKDFIFTGWHSQCRCYITPVIGKPADVRAGKVTPQKDLPPQFKTWMQANQQRLLTARTIPYFIRNNKQKIVNEVDMDDAVLNVLGEHLKNGIDEKAEREATRAFESQMSKIKPTPEGVTPEEANAMWASNPHKAIKPPYSKPSDIANILNKISEQGWTNGKTISLSVDDAPGQNGQTNMDGHITLTSDRMRLVQNAMQKIGSKRAFNMTPKEADAMCTLWHEIVHNQSKTAGAKIEYEEEFYEMQTEYIARVTMADFYGKMGVMHIPYEELIHDRKSTAYNTQCMNIESAIEALDINKNKFDKALIANHYRYPADISSYAFRNAITESTDGRFNYEEAEYIIGLCKNTKTTKDLVYLLSLYGYTR